MEEFETHRGFRVPKGRGVPKRTSRNTGKDVQPLSALNARQANANSKKEQSNKEMGMGKPAFNKHAFPHLTAEEKSYLSPNYRRPPSSQRPVMGGNSSTTQKSSLKEENDLQYHIERAANVLFEVAKKTRRNLRAPSQEARKMRQEEKEKISEIGYIFDRNQREILKYIKKNKN